MDNLIQHKSISGDTLFADRYMDSKVFYLYHFNSVPCVSFMKYIDGEKACITFQEKYAGLIESVHQYKWFDKKENKMVFDETLLVLKNNCVFEFGRGYAELLHHNDATVFIQEVIDFLKKFKERARRKPLEMNIIVKSGSYLELKSMEIKKTKLDLDLFYEDDFKAVDEVIRKRLNKKNDKGIVLLHGLPGSGKTTYLRYLFGKIKKKVMFLPPNMGSCLTDPDFIDLLIDNPNTVMVIEDAENIIMDRRTNSNSSVSNLLNISDGLLADFLNVQLICTFNSPLTMVDSALMRKGRLIAKYEFGKLGIEKAQRLSNHFGFDKKIRQPMSVAEISNQHEAEQKENRTEVMGFRRHLAEN